MIKFFRRIRQKLLSENKFSKYLIYAIGEIILVVIGILIALQLNEMREERKEREKERAYLKELNLDFRSNKEQLDTIIRHNKEALKAGKRLKHLMYKMKKEVKVEHYSTYHLNDSLFIYQSKMFTNKSFNPKNGTVRALINSSSFDLIQNDSLRRMLISWNDMLGDYLEEEDFAMKFLFDEYYPWVRAAYNYEDEFSQQNMETWLSTREYNFREERITELEYLIEVVEREGIVKIIDNIIRLTETDYYD
ncbi:DUF6090 family protein [Winogradskyella sp. 3972H.M.0a.05]|uniref:DUF6090 family protein n=1 Tax=Winogradskyella sp. 3972H.M.0a.05 TaxID=2950277 RepID=UPI0033980D0A